MRPIRSFLLLAFLILPSLALADEEAEHAALRQIRALYEKAVNEDRLELLGPHLATPFHGVMITGQPVTSLAEMKEYWASMKKLMGPGGTYRVMVVPQRSVIAGDFALARGTTQDAVTTSEGRVFRFGTNWTAVLHKQDGVWKIVQVQGSMDPIRNEFVTTFMKEAMMKVGAGAGVGGLLLGSVLGIVIGRRKRA